MSEHDSILPSLASVSPADSAAPESDVAEAAKRPRGKIPRHAWAYVLGLYDRAHETLKSIGDRFGVEPSAVHYVLKQARLQNLEPTLEMPESDTLAVLPPRRAPIPRQNVRMPQIVHPAAPPAPPPVDAAVEEVSCSPLARRVFDAAAAIINAMLAFEQDPSRENAQQLEETRKIGSRALAAVEIWTHQMTALQSKQPSAAPVPGTPAAPRLVEVA